MTRPTIPPHITDDEMLLLRMIVALNAAKHACRKAQADYHATLRAQLKA